MESGIRSPQNKSLLVLFLILGGYFVFFGLSIFFPQQETCVFKLITGIPCPGCGMGRASYSLFSGNIIESFLFHPLAIPFNIFILVVVAWLIYDIIHNQFTLIPRLKRKAKPIWTIIIVILVVALWVYNIVRGI